ncbi:hypothetical protein Avbf_05213 [Armadillidium vulgare]|nr:hypothetical protein Avbf_05213 [Armadillidium vulgare]
MPEGDHHWVLNDIGTQPSGINSNTIDNTRDTLKLQESLKLCITLIQKHARDTLKLQKLKNFASLFNTLYFTMTPLNVDI